MNTMNRISKSLIFWQIMFFVMAGVAAYFAATPRIVREYEPIYLIYQSPEDTHPIETRVI